MRFHSGLVCSCDPVHMTRKLFFTLNNICKPTFILLLTTRYKSQEVGCEGIATLRGNKTHTWTKSSYRYLSFIYWHATCISKNLASILFTHAFVHSSEPCMADILISITQDPHIYLIYHQFRDRFASILKQL